MTTRLDKYQQNVVNATADYIIVSAGAGAGKTHTLVSVYLKNVKEQKYNFMKVPVITFTEKAGEELRKRIRDKVRELIVQNKLPPEKIAWLEKAPIGTIHGFCSRILRDFPLRSGMDERTRVMEEVESTLLLRETVENEITRLLDENSPADEITNDLKEILIAEEYYLHGVVAKLWRLIQSARRYGNPERTLFPFTKVTPDLEQYLKRIINGSTTQYPSIKEQNPYIRRLEMAFNVTVASRIGLFSDALTNFAKGYILSVLDELINIYKRNNLQSKRSLAKICNGIASLPQNMDPDILLLEAGSIAMATRASIQRRYFSSENEWKSFKNILSAIKEIYKRYRYLPGTSQQIISLLEERMKKELNTTKCYVNVAKYLAEQYNIAKKNRKVIDMDDILIKTEGLLLDKNVLRILQNKYPVIMIDEFQDTNALQYRIISKIAKKIIMVGDPKQSIYRFRGGDVSQFMAIWRGSIKEKTLQKLTLQNNYRSSPKLLDFFNFLFEIIMNKMKGIPPLKHEVDYAKMYPGPACKCNKEVHCPVSLVKIKIGTDGEDISVEELVIGEAYTIASIIRTLIRKYGFSPGDIAILLRSTNRLGIYTNALMQYAIPYKVVVGRGFYMSQEIADVLNFLKILALPHDNVAYVGILRSPFVGMKDEALVYYLLMKRGHSLEPGILSKYESEFKKAKFIESKILEFKNLTGKISNSELIRKIVEETGYVAAIGALPDGKERVANIYKLIELVSSVEGAVPLPAYKIIQYLVDMRENLAREPPAHSEVADKETVKLLTIHASKGLEFPVVILPAGASGSRIGSGLLYDIEIGFYVSLPLLDAKGYKIKTPLAAIITRYLQDKDRAEIIRLLYVAMTRSICKLVLTVPYRKNKDSEIISTGGMFVNYFLWDIMHSFMENCVDDVSIEDLAEVLEKSTQETAKPRFTVTGKLVSRISIEERKIEPLIGFISNTIDPYERESLFMRNVVRDLIRYIILGHESESVMQHILKIHGIPEKPEIKHYLGKICESIQKLDIFKSAVKQVPLTDIIIGYNGRKESFDIVYRKDGILHAIRIVDFRENIETIKQRLRAILGREQSHFYMLVIRENGEVSLEEIV